MTPVENLLAKLPDAKKSGKGWSARCPAHDDLRASLSVSEGDEGSALVKCHAGCDTQSVLSAVGMTLAELFPAGIGSAPDRNGRPATDRTFATASAVISFLDQKHGTHSASWTYHDPQGDPVGLVVRWDHPEGKVVRPVARRGDTWCIGAMPEPRPLYGLPEILAAPRVVVVEGEKAADAARAIGFAATTSAGGSQAAGKTDWSPLAGKEVWILPDNDLPGRKYAEAVADILAGLTPAPTVRILDLAEHAPALPDHGDLADVLADDRWCGLPLGDSAEPVDLAALIERLAQAVVPWRPNEPDDLAFRPFPVDTLPEPIRCFVVAGSKAIGCDPSLIALPLLVAVASAIGDSRRLQLKRGWDVPAILWAAVVGESGTAKTPALKLAMRPFRARQRKALKRHAEEMKRFEADLACWEKSMATWRRNKSEGDEPPEKPVPPVAERFLVSDVTVEALAVILLENPRGVLQASDELAGWFGSFDRYAGKGKPGADAAHWLSMFNAEGIIVDRKTGSPRTICVPQAAVCVTGGIQPGILRRALGNEHRESGLLARLLLTWPPRRAKRWVEADIDPATEAGLARLLDRLFELQPRYDEDGEPRPALVHLTPEAKVSWTAYYNDHAAEQVNLTGDLAAAWSKLEEYAARLALVIHFARWAANNPTLASADLVDADSMAAGIRLANWFKHEARRVYAMLDETDSQRDQRRLVDWIDRKDGSVTTRDVQSGCRWLKKPGAAEEALEGLAKAGLGSWRVIQTTARGGRPSREFTLSKAPTSTKPPDSAEENGFRRR